MTAKDLVNKLLEFEQQGVDLSDLPLVIFEGNIGITVMKHHIQMVNINKFNELNDRQQIKNNLYKNAIVIGSILTVD